MLSLLAIGYIISIAPIVGWSWPALAPLILLAAGKVGADLIFDSRDNSPVTQELRRRLLEERSITLEVEGAVSDAVFEEVRRGDAMIFQKDGMLLTITKDERNKLKVTVTAPKDVPRPQLERAGKEFVHEVAQLFAQNRIVEQLERLNFDLVGEEKAQDGEIRLKVRRYRSED